MGESESRAGFLARETTGANQGRGLDIEFEGFVGEKRRQRGVGKRERVWIWRVRRKEREGLSSMMVRLSEGERGKERGGEVGSAQLCGRVGPVSPARTGRGGVCHTGWG
jgi:hypothetical protein